MANRDDVDRVLAGCGDCDAVYAARKWPNGDIQLIGQDACECGSTTFVVVDDSDVMPESDDSDAGSGVGDE